MTDIYTTSSIGAFQACAKLYDLRMNEELEAIDRPPYFALGSLFHEAKEAWALGGRDINAAKAVIRSAEVSDEDIRCKVYAMMTAYHDVWRMFDVGYRAVEQEFMCTTGSGKRLAGICDAIVFHEGRWWIMETKTAATVDDNYINRMQYQRQSLLYFYAITRLLGDTPIEGGGHYRDVAGVLYDFIQKPSSKRKKATPVDKRKFTKGGELYKGQRETDEGDIDYTNRMHDWYAENKYSLIKRVEVVFSNNQIDSFVEDLHGAIKLIEHCKREDVWPMSLSACHAYNRPCEFAGYCRSGGSPMVLANFYKKREKRFSEFKGEIGGENGSDTTNGKD